MPACTHEHARTLARMYAYRECPLCRVRVRRRLKITEMLPNNCVRVVQLEETVAAQA